MIVLKDGTKRFSEIRREIEGISERMLTETLKQLEVDGMLLRKSFDTVPLPTLSTPSPPTARKRQRKSTLLWSGWKWI